MTRRPVPPPPAAFLAECRRAPVWERLADVDLAGREILAFAVGELFRSDQIRTGRRSTISELLDGIVTDWSRWSQHADALEAELAELPWPTEAAA